MKYFCVSGIVMGLFCSSVYAPEEKAVTDPTKLFEERKKQAQEIFGKAYSFILDEVKKEGQFRLASGSIGGALSTPTTIPTRENKFVDQRQNAVHKGLKKIYGNTINDTLDLHIGIVLAGSELSGLIGSVGFLKELKNTGLLDIATYIASSSNASWPVMSWLSGGVDFTTVDPSSIITQLTSVYADLKKAVSDDGVKFSQDFGKKMVDELQMMLKDVLLPKYIFAQQIGAADIASLPLAMILFSNKPNRYRLSLEEQLPQEIGGDYEALEPFPLYMAVVDDAQKSEYIFSPFEITTQQNKKLYAFPTYAFNRIFKNGAVPDGMEFQAPEVNIPFLMALMGSRMVGNVEALAKSVLSTSSLGALPQPRNTLEKYAYLLARREFSKQVDTKIAELKKKYGVKDEYTYSSLIQNPFFEFTQVPEAVRKEPLLTFMDASIGHGIAAEPLLRKERNLDLIVVCNASDTSAQVASLNNFIKKVETNFGISYERVSKDGKSEQVAQEDNLTLQLYRPKKTGQGPDIVYLSMRKPSDALFVWAKRYAQQDSVLHAYVQKEGATRTGTLTRYLGEEMARIDKSLQYNPTSFGEIMNRAQFNLRANFFEIIKDLIADIIHNKKGFTQEGEIQEETNSHSGLF